VDDVYLDTNAFEFALVAPGYDSAAEVWQAVKDTPGLAVISADSVPSRQSFSVSVGEHSSPLRMFIWRMTHWMAQSRCR